MEHILQACFGGTSTFGRVQFHGQPLATSILGTFQMPAYLVYKVEKDEKKRLLGRPFVAVDFLGRYLPKNARYQCFWRFNEYVNSNCVNVLIGHIY